MRVRQREPVARKGRTDLGHVEPGLAPTARGQGRDGLADADVDLRVDRAADIGRLLPPRLPG